MLEMFCILVVALVLYVHTTNETLIGFNLLYVNYLLKIIFNKVLKEKKDMHNSLIDHFWNGNGKIKGLEELE